MNQRDPSTCPKDTLGTQQPRKYPTCPGPSQARRERNIRQIRKLHTSRPEWGANHISLNITCNHCKPLFIPLLFLKWFYRGTNLLESHKKKNGSGKHQIWTTPGSQGRPSTPQPIQPPPHSPLTQLLGRKFYWDRHPVDLNSGPRWQAKTKRIDIHVFPNKPLLL